VSPIIARAPVRIDLGGSLTDVPPYPERDGGVTLSVSITKYATVTLQECNQRAAQDPAARPVSVLEAALRRFSCPAVEATLATDYPVRSGLGGSSAACVAIVGALAERTGVVLTPEALAAMSREIEVVGLGLTGGYQDHYAAAYGGALLARYSDKVRVERISLMPVFAADFKRRTLVIDTREPRHSSDVVELVRAAYCAGDVRVVRALADLKKITFEMALALREHDIVGLARLVSTHWSRQHSIHPAITTPRIDAVIDTATRHGALGGKVLGAGGGGCVMVIADAGRELEVEEAVAPLGSRVEYTIDPDGFTIL
jgi:D-glycero-alpha-D-manno-heptose-7-phosphate kinase